MYIVLKLNKNNKKKLVKAVTGRKKNGNWVKLCIRKLLIKFNANFK